MPLEINKTSDTERKLFVFMSEVIPEFDYSQLSVSDGEYGLAGVSLKDLTMDSFGDRRNSSRKYVDGIFLPRHTENIWMYMNDGSVEAGHMKEVGGKLNFKQAAKLLEQEGILIASRRFTSRYALNPLYKKTVIYMNKEGDIREFIGIKDLNVSLDEYLQCLYN